MEVGCKRFGHGVLTLAMVAAIGKLLRRYVFSTLFLNFTIYCMVLCSWLGRVLNTGRPLLPCCGVSGPTRVISKPSSPMDAIQQLQSNTPEPHQP